MAGVRSSYNLSFRASRPTLSIYRDRISESNGVQDGSSGVRSRRLRLQPVRGTQVRDDRIAEVRRGVEAMSGHGRSAPWDRGPRRQEGPGPLGRRLGRPVGRLVAGPARRARPAARPKASRGDVRAAILALLKEGPRNGYQIMSEIEERSRGAWRPSPGAVYPALSALADEGLIVGEESAGQADVPADRRRPRVRRGEPRHGPRRLGVRRAAGGLAGARPVRRGGPARRRHRAGRPGRARPSRCARRSGCWRRPGGGCTGSSPTTTTTTKTTTRTSSEGGRAMNDHIRVSDADRERVADAAARALRRGTAVPPTSWTSGSRRRSARRPSADLRRVTADLPDRRRPAPEPPQAGRSAALGRVARVRVPARAAAAAAGAAGADRGAGDSGRGLPVLRVRQGRAAVLAGGRVAAIFAAARFRRHVRRHWQSGPRGPWSQYHDQWRQYQWRG